QEFREWFSKMDRSPPPWWPAIKGQIDFTPLSQSRSPSTYLAAPLPIASELAQAWGTPGFSMITLDDLRLRRDTPTDTLANLNVDAILPQVAATREVLWRAWSDPAFRGQPDYKWQRTQFSGQVVSPAPGKPVPDLPREG